MSLRFYSYVETEDLFGDVFWCLWHDYLEMYVIYPLRCFWEKNYMHAIWDLLKTWRLFI